VFLDVQRQPHVLGLDRRPGGQLAPIALFLQIQKGRLQLARRGHLDPVPVGVLLDLGPVDQG
jgi:hypothetical protein